VGKLQSHLGQADDDVKNILISTGKVAGRAERIERVELPQSETATKSPALELDQNVRRALNAAESAPSSR
jgi:DNA anti-recombination protein RmuC